MRCTSRPASAAISLSPTCPPLPGESVDNGPDVVPRPANAWPVAPKGFKVDLYVTGLDNPRLLRTAPNGDLFLAESEPARSRSFAAWARTASRSKLSVFATGLHQPFGIAFYPSGSNPAVGLHRQHRRHRALPLQERRPDGNRTPCSTLADLPGGGRLRGGGHWTRDVVFSQDGTKLFASVGSHSNVDDSDTHPEEFHRADVLEFTPEGKFVKVYAWGLRNCVGEAINPITGELWCSTNERDGLGNNLVPDYVTHVQEGGFYGWPWFYYNGPGGGIQDPRHPGKHPELQSKVLTPDILVNPHFASLEMLFYEGSAVPCRVQGRRASPAEHGSWNRAQRSGYEVIRLPMKNGRATGEYEDFLTGFVTPDGQVWGRPVGVAQANDGSLFVSDDGSRSIWHVSIIAEGDLLIGGAQILVRIDRNMMDAHLIVQVRPGGAARLAHVADHLAAHHMLAGHDRYRRKMAVDRQHIVAVVEHDLAAVSGAHVGFR
jgi:glucose/arabinose dehydrogenase